MVTQANLSYIRITCMSGTIFVKVTLDQTCVICGSKNEKQPKIASWYLVLNDFIGSVQSYVYMRPFSSHNCKRWPLTCGGYLVWIDQYDVADSLAPFVTRSSVPMILKIEYIHISPSSIRNYFTHHYRVSRNRKYIFICPQNSAS